jgi:hypothetical protein
VSAAEDLAAAIQEEREAWADYVTARIAYGGGDGNPAAVGDASFRLTEARVDTDGRTNRAGESVVYLATADIRDLCKILLDASRRGSTVRLWVDDGGLKYSIDRRTWSYPPIGTTTNPDDF